MIKTNFIILLLTTLVCFSISGQKLTCKDLKNGVFTIFGDSTKTQTTIIRKGNSQTEKHNESSTPLQFKVKWVNECTYTLIPSKETLKQFKESELPDIGVLTVTILEIRDNSYIQSSTSSVYNFVYTSEMFFTKN